MAIQHTLQELLSVADAARASRTFEKLFRHDMRHWAVTGGLAVDIHLHRLGRQPSISALNDLDFITSSFGRIPETLAHSFLFRHIHASDPPDKLILQFVDPDSALRIDVFRTHDSIMKRSSYLELACGTMQIISVEDLLARAARIVLDLSEAVPTPSKHARDFLLLANVVPEAEVEPAWQDHRKQKHPATFSETSSLLKDLITAHPELLITARYSQDMKRLCPRCASSGAFHLSEPSTIMASLGYC